MTGRGSATGEVGDKWDAARLVEDAVKEAVKDELDNPDEHPEGKTNVTVTYEVENE